MFGSEDVRIEIIGDPLKIETAFRARNEIQMQHMGEAMMFSLVNLQQEWKGLAPVGKGKPEDSRAPTWRERTPGTYVESIQIDPPTPLGEDNLIGAVFSDDQPVARILESGSGIYRRGPGRGGRPMIYPTSRKKLAIPATHLMIGGNRGKKGAQDPGARFLKSVRGQRPQEPARRARVASAVTQREAFKRHVKMAADEIKAML